MTGKRYHSLVAIKPVGAIKNQKHISWLFKCDCGKEKVINGADVRKGHNKACGCKRHNTQIKHGHARRTGKSRAYTAWKNMRARCFVKSNKQYKDYGGRGITICKRWHKFESFLGDMGERPSNLTLERIDNNGNYEPKNCRWATRLEQSKNTRKNVFVLHKGSRKHLAEWSRVTGIDHRILSRETKCGRTLGDTIKKYGNHAKKEGGK